MVISKLAETGGGKSGKDKFVPYRDSALTWLLKDRQVNFERLYVRGVVYTGYMDCLSTKKRQSEGYWWI